MNLRHKTDAEIMVVAGMLLLSLAVLCVNLDGVACQVVNETVAQQAKHFSTCSREEASSGQHGISVRVLPQPPLIPEAAVRSLANGKPCAEDIKLVYAFLESKNVPLNMTPMQSDALKNDLMNMLRNLEQPPADLSEKLIQLHTDLSQDTLVRVYALQHLAAWYDQITRAPLLGKKPYYRLRPGREVADVREVLRAALDECHNGMAGTAILAHFYLLENHPELDAAEVAESALKLAGDERCDPVTRISAIQVCGRMGLQEALPLARDLALHGSGLPLQAAAIATVGDLGGEGDRSLLAEIAGTCDLRLRVACESALKRLGKHVSAQGKAG